jgi:hypothetical protein
LFDLIIDHKKGADALSVKDAMVEHQGKKHPKRTTRGWKLCVLWTDGSKSWLALKDIKESHPLQVAVYVIAHNLGHEPAFTWWVPHVLRRCEQINKAVKSRYLCRDKKFGIEFHTVKRALETDS